MLLNRKCSPFSPKDSFHIICFYFPYDRQEAHISYILLFMNFNLVSFSSSHECICKRGREIDFCLSCQSKCVTLVLGPAGRSRSHRQAAGSRRGRVADRYGRAAAPQVPQGHHPQHARPQGAQPGDDQSVLGQHAHPAPALLDHR